MIMGEVEGNEAPRYIYKYMSIENLEKLILNSSLHFSKVSAFNDPFEFKAYIVCEAPKETIKRFLTEECGYSNRRAKQQPIDTKEMKEYINSKIPNILEGLSVCCFSKNPSNILMWSHYANKHEGVCVKFDTLNSSIFQTATEVSYGSPFLPKYNFFTDSKNEGLHKQIYNKAPDWSYEEEMRIVNLNGDEKVSFNKIHLVEIIFGYKCDLNHILKIRDMIKVNEYANANFSKMEISQKEYRLIRKQLR